MNRELRAHFDWVNTLSLHYHGQPLHFERYVIQPGYTTKRWTFTSDSADVRQLNAGYDRVYGRTLSDCLVKMEERFKELERERRRADEVEMQMRLEERARVVRDLRVEWLKRHGRGCFKPKPKNADLDARLAQLRQMVAPERVTIEMSVESSWADNPGHHDSWGSPLYRIVVGPVEGGVRAAGLGSTMADALNHLMYKLERRERSNA